MSTSKNKAAVRRLNEAMNKGDFSYLSELFAPEYVFHTAQEVRGPEGVKQQFINMRKAFPDYHEKIERMVAEGDMVAVFYTLTGTFTGEMAGMTPTGKKINAPGAVLARFKNGKQVEAWPYMDELTFYRQMGVPIPPQ